MANDWRTLPLGHLLKRVRDEIAIQDDEKYRLLTIRLWNRGVVLRENRAGVDISTKRQFRVRAGYLVLSRIDIRNGAVGLVPLELDGAIVSNDFWTYKIDETTLMPAFLALYTKTPRFLDAANRASSGTTKRIRANEEAFLGIQIPVPPLSEQRRIVGRIEELAAKIEEARGLRREAEENAEALFEQARAQAFEKAALQGVRPLSEIATLERGRFSHRPRNDTRFFGGDHPWIQITEIERSAKYIREWSETLNDAGLAISKKFPKGTVLISIAATIGAVGILDFDCCIPDSIVGLMPNEGADSEFIYHYLGYVRTHLESIAPQSAQKNINLRILAGLPVPQVTLPVQRSIVTELDTLQAEVDRLKRLQSDTAAELDALLPSVLDRAFRGEL